MQFLSHRAVLVLALLTVATCLFAGGSQQSQSGSAAVADPDFVVSYPISDGAPIELTAWTFLPGVVTRYISNYAETEVFQEIFRRTGVEVEFAHPAGGQAEEQFNLLIASGDLPDIIGQNPWGAAYYKGGSSAGVEDGVFVDLTDLVPTYAPDFYQMLLDDPALFRDATDNDGRIPAFFAAKEAFPPWRRFSVREDVLAEIGMSYPRYVDEYDAMFEAMLDIGLIPYSLAENGNETLFVGMFDVVPGFFQPEPGVVGYGQIEEGYLEYLTLMNDWYERGFISTDFMMMTEQDNLALFDNRELGMVMRPVDLVYTRSVLNGYEFFPLEYPRLRPGQELHHEASTVTRYRNADTNVSANSDQQEIAIQFLNYFYTEEGRELANYGVEGVSWEWAGTRRVFTDHMLENADGIDRNAAQNMMKLHAWARFADPDVIANPNVIADEQSLAFRMLHSDDSTIDDALHLPPLRLSTDANSERASIMAEIQTYVDEMTLRFITGATPLSEFDDFVETMRRLGIDRAIELTQEAFDIYLAKEVG